MNHFLALWAATSFIPSILFLIITPFLLCAAILISTFILTTVRYRVSLHAHLTTTSKFSSLLPPTIPYVIPILGSALSFLTPYPGVFWRKLFATHPRETGACTLQLGGQTTHVLFDQTAISAFFKARGLERDRFNIQLTSNGLGANIHDVHKFWGQGETKREAREKQEAIVQRYLIRTDRVTELSDTFVKAIQRELHDTGKDRNEACTVGIATWIRSRMFTASVRALMGDKLFDVYPEIIDDWSGYDEAIMSLFCGIPRFIIPEKYAARAKILHGLTRYQRAAWDECKGVIPEPDGVSWEPLYGSRYNRARQLYYQEQQMSFQGKAAMDGGTMFGLASNPPPGVGWTLIHIFNPKGDSTLYPRLIQELSSARKADDSLDCRVLFGLPLLQSVLHEVLRLYADIIVVRDMHEDLTLPLAGGKRHIFLPNSTTVMAPSWVAQHDESWTKEGVPADRFYAERFLKRDSDSGKEIFSLTDSNGRFFPFGGGRDICPGRVFAKQIMMIAIATVLLEFQINPLCFINSKGQSCNDFPQFGREYAGAGVVRPDGDLKVRLETSKR